MTDSEKLDRLAELRERAKEARAHIATLDAEGRAAYKEQKAQEKRDKAKAAYAKKKELLAKGKEAEAKETAPKPATPVPAAPAPAPTPTPAPAAPAPAAPEPSPEPTPEPAPEPAPVEPAPTPAPIDHSIPRAPKPPTHKQDIVDRSKPKEGRPGPPAIEFDELPPPETPKPARRKKVVILQGSDEDSADETDEIIYVKSKNIRGKLSTMPTRGPTAPPPTPSFRRRPAQGTWNPREVNILRPPM